MAGHSHWKQIKHKKAAADQKKSKIISKLLNAILIAAREEPSPQFNPRLRAAIQAAREESVSQDNIERAIQRSQNTKEQIEEVTMETYGPEGVAVVITAITDNKNRTIQEIKTLFKDNNLKLAEPGSVLWNFEKSHDDQRGWLPRFTKTTSEETKRKLGELIQKIEDREDVQKVYTNAEW